MHEPNPQEVDMNRSTVLAVAVLLTILGAMPATAARKAAPQIGPRSEGPTLRVGGKEGTTPTCIGGHNLPPTVSVHPWLQPPNDAYYTLIDPAACATCPEGMLVTKAHVVLRFQAACAQPVVISIVGNNGTEQCPNPDPSQVLCPPETHNLNGTTDTQTDFTVTLATSCPITQKA